MKDHMARARRDAIRAEYAEEEAENAEAEALENEQNEQAVLSVRVPAQLAESLKARASAEHVPTSALVRRILTQAVHRGSDAPVMTVAEVEQIARRVIEESARD